MKLTVSDTARQRLKERYEEGKIAALNGHSAPLFKNKRGEYCLLGGMMPDDYIRDRHELQGMEYYDIYTEIFTSGYIRDAHSDIFQRITQVHDEVNRTKNPQPLVRAIESIIQTGELVISNRGKL